MLAATQGVVLVRKGLVRRGRVRERANWAAGVLGGVWLLIVAAPIWYVVLASLRSQPGYETLNPWIPTRALSLANFGAVLEEGFTRYLLNSVVVTVSADVLATGCALLAGYAISRGRSRFTRVVFRVFLLGLAIPATAVLIPLFYVVTSIGLYDTYWAIILPSAAFCLPVSVLIMANFLRDIPGELFDAMAVDGATERAVLFRLVVPFSRPALMTVLIFNALAVWNGFIFPLILTSSPNYRVLPLAVFNFESYYTINVPAVLAAVVITSLPLVLVYVVGRRYLMTGMVAGYAK